MRVSPSLAALLAIALAGSALAQRLTSEQRVADMRQLAATYAKNYGPYEWKKEVRNFDLYNLKPWIERAEKTTDDLEFADLLVEYVASLDDAHDNIAFPTTWTASLGFTTDIYDGKVLIDSINRGRLPAAQFPFGIGDEVIAMDGKSVDEWLTRFSRYAIAANPVSTRRNAAARLTARSQSSMPLAPRWTPDRSTVTILRAGSGATETYEMTWLKSGVELEFGALPTPGTMIAARAKAAPVTQDADPLLPPHMVPLRGLMNISVSTDHFLVLNYGGRNPIFTLPANFQRRLGGAAADVFFSGTFEAEGKRIGFIRIPNYAPANPTLGINQFITEMLFFQQNTDGLIIDEMRNPGGNSGYCEILLSLIMPNTFRTLGFEIRATSYWVNVFAQIVQLARLSGLPDWQIAMLEANLANVQETNRGNRARTGPISLNSSGSLELAPGPVFYSKPLIVLVDEFSASGGDFFPAVVQDNKRGLIVGMRTMGAGGSVVPYNGTSYTEGSARVTQSLMHRKDPITTTDYPVTQYVENVGVRPDVQIDFMTRENLLTEGRPFFGAVTKVMVDHIAAGGR